MAERVPLNLSLHPKQDEVRRSKATEILYGGAAGGGKSFLLRILAIYYCAAIPGLCCYLFRRQRPDLIKNHVEGRKGFRALLAPWVAKGLVEIVNDEVRFWNGSKIFLCHCKDEKDRFNYQGAEIDLLLIDELTHFTEVIYRFLRSRLRSTALVLPAEIDQPFPRIICGSNPGNIGHSWVKETWVARFGALHGRPSPVVRVEDAEGGMLRQYIPALLEDNPSMAEDDPGYRLRLRGLGSPQLVKAMEEGNWDVIAGAYFPEFKAHKHGIAPFEIPPTWARNLSMDWGSAKPFSVGWFSVAPVGAEIPYRDSRIVVASPTLIMYRHWYGGHNNVGFKLTVPEVGRGILQREAGGEKLEYRVADPSIFQENGGPSIAEQFRTATGGKVTFRPGDNARLAGWQIMRSRMEPEQPLLLVFDTCPGIFRSIPSLLHSETRPEDLDTKQEDHDADMLRYEHSSRPWAKPTPASRPPTSLNEVTLDQLWKEQERNRRRPRI